MPGRSIKIFLVDGSSSGIRTAELGLSTIKALVVPRASLAICSKRPEPKRTGVYVLIGHDDDGNSGSKIYIGEGDTILTRIIAHDKDEDKDFWEEAVLITSKDDNLTKSHVRYLEARLIQLSQNAKRVEITNETNPSVSNMLPESDENEMEEFILQIRLLLGTLGYSIFDPLLTPSFVLNKNTEEPLIDELPIKFTYIGDNFNATCDVDQSAGLFIVKENSLVKKAEANSLKDSYKNLRKQMIEKGILQDFNELQYTLTQDYSFGSVSAAAQVVSGTTINGRNAWKMNGKTYGDWQDEQQDLNNETGS